MRTERETCNSLDQERRGAEGSSYDRNFGNPTYMGNLRRTDRETSLSTLSIQNLQFPPTAARLRPPHGSFKPLTGEGTDLGPHRQVRQLICRRRITARALQKAYCARGITYFCKTALYRHSPHFGRL